MPERPRSPRSLGKMLGHLHRDLADCRYAAPKTLFAPLLEIATTWGTGTHTVDELLDGFANVSPASAEYCRSVLAVVRARVAALDTSAMTRTLIHGDWHAGNLLYTRGEVTGVLDFDFAHPDLRVADLAVSAMLVDGEAAVEMIGGYREVQELPDEELGLLNLCAQARTLGAVAATLSIRSRGEEVHAGPEFLTEMLQKIEARWPAMEARLGLA